MDEVADGVHRLTPGVCNFYLIVEGRKLVLVDAEPLLAPVGLGRR